MPFEFFLRFQRSYIQNVIKVFDKTLSQLFLVARKKVKHHIEDQATQIYLIVLLNRRRQFPKMGKKNEISKNLFLFFPPSWIYSF